jgi:acyl-CoA thioesterase I
MNEPTAARWALLPSLLLCGLLLGCDSDDHKLSNGNPGGNSRHVVAAFGDSITMGNRCPCPPYPAQLQPFIGKTVVNAGINGTTARASVDRTQAVINQTRPAYMLILYGVNDMIHSQGVPGTLAALEEIIRICKQNQVAPAIATYPVPVKSYRAFAFNIIALNQGIRRLAGAQGIPCVDLEREFALPGYPDASGDVHSDPTLFTGEGLHPNDAGTRIMARVFADLF